MRTSSMIARLPFLLLVLLGLLAAVPAAMPAPAYAAEPRTVVIDAVDDDRGSRWESAETGGPVVTVRVGDTVEWQFDRAVIEHDLTSEDARSVWTEPVQEYRAPGGAPVRRTFHRAGSYEFLCSLHGTVMRGTVIVEDAGGNAAPDGTATATPASGDAPLEVHFAADLTDADGDPIAHAWDFGTSDDATDTATGAHAAHTYTAPGSYTATLVARDGRGGEFRRELPIAISDGATVLPEVDAHAHHDGGAAPLPVAFSTAVGTDGTFSSYADGLTTYPDLTGTASLRRSRGQTRATLEVTGLKPGAAHMVHVHEQACGSAHGGAHFRFDETQPFAADNEVWLPFTSDASGSSGVVTVSQPIRAGAKAVSIVIHDPDNPAKRIGCADLAPGTAGLAYDWDFGDGATATGPDPDHTYVTPGAHTATVTVTAPGGASVSASVEVQVQVEAPPDGVPPQTRVVVGPSGTVRSASATFHFGSSETGSRFLCRLDARPWTGCRSSATLHRLRDGPHRLLVRAVDAAGNADPTAAVRRWTVDSNGPMLWSVRPADSTQDRTPTVTARVRDEHSTVRAVALRVDGRPVVARYDARRGLVLGQIRRALAPGRHVVRLVAADAAGNRTVRTWAFRVRR